MRTRGLITAFAAMLLMVAMFVSVHRGAYGRQTTERISGVNDRREAAEAERGELQQKIEYLRSRTRIVRAARQLGLHLPDEEELVILDLRSSARGQLGGSR